MADGGFFGAIKEGYAEITAATTAKPQPPVTLPTTPGGIDKLLDDSRTAILKSFEASDALGKSKHLGTPAGVLSKMFDKDIGQFMLGTALTMAQDPKQHAKLKTMLFPEGETPKIPVDKQDAFIKALGDKTTYADSTEGAAKFEALIQMADPGRAKLKANLATPEAIAQLRDDAKKPPKGIDGLMAQFDEMKGKLADGFMSALENPTGPGAQALYNMPLIGPLLQALMPMLSGFKSQLEGAVNAIPSEGESQGSPAASKAETQTPAPTAAPAPGAPGVNGEFAVAGADTRIEGSTTADPKAKAPPSIPGATPETPAPVVDNKPVPAAPTGP